MIEWSSGRSESSTKSLAVGIEVELALFGKLLGSGGQDRTIHTLLATIDESTETFAPDYCFSDDFIGWAKDNSALAIPLKSCDADSEVKFKGWIRLTGCGGLGSSTTVPMTRELSERRSRVRLIRTLPTRLDKRYCRPNIRIKLNG